MRAVREEARGATRGARGPAYATPPPAPEAQHCLTREVDMEGEEVREMAEVAKRLEEVQGGELRFIQIAAGDGNVYGLASDGRVYQYLAARGGWRLLPMKQG